MTKRTLPPFTPHGLHGFTSCVIDGRIRHLPTYEPVELEAVEYRYLHTLPHTGTHIYVETATGTLFAMPRGTERLG